MSVNESMMPQSAVRPATWRVDAMLGLSGALLALGLHALAGFPTLAGANGDNDSLLRLVEIRDLIGGQPWFDLHQYRMGPPGGFVMHWSRLIDAPIAAVVLVVSALTGKVATGEAVALFAWTTPLMAVALTFLLRIARAAGDEWATMPAFIIGAAALHFGGVFAPGDIDHHNVQLTLCLGTITALVAGRGHLAGIAAGAACALMLAVGMETLPYVAVAGLAVATAYLLSDRSDAAGEAAKAAGFGAGLAGAGLAAFVATVPVSSWLSPHCDAYSIPQFSVAAVSGIGLAAAAASPALGRSFGTRLAALLALGIAAAALAVTAFPQCLGDPYAGLDPKLQQFWLDQVTEAQPFWRVLADNRVKAAGLYVTPILALIVLVLRLRRRSSAAGWLLLAFLSAAFAVSLWQVRGATFSLPLAAVALAAWVGDWRCRTASAADRYAMPRMAMAWLVSLNVTWSAAAHAAASALGQAEPAAASPAGTCERPADYAILAAQPPTTVLAISNLGSPILARTPHRTQAGPYHRNASGNLLALDAFTGPAEQARATIESNRIGLVVLCRGNAETALLTGQATAGLLAALVRGEPPDWLEKVPRDAGEPLDIYRVRPHP